MQKRAVLLKNDNKKVVQLEELLMNLEWNIILQKD